MVLLKKTEIKYKTIGFNKMKNIYVDKIEEQKQKFNKRIQVYEGAIEKKNVLINDLNKEIEAMQRNNHNSKYNDIITVFQQCANVMEKDINIISKKKSECILNTSDILTALTKYVQK